MKTFSIKASILFVVLFLIQKEMVAQVINWASVSTKDKQLLHVNAGVEYGLTAGLGYHHLIPIKNFPFWVGGEMSTPGGNKPIDDFKLKVGGQFRIAAFYHFQIAARVQGIARRYQNQSVTIFNFGSDVAGTVGYYRERWFIGAEAGFDKAIVTHFNHSDWYRKNIYDQARDGWYEPATGGNFYYALLGGYSMKKVDFTLKAGKLLQQDFKTQPMLPFYGQLGVNFRF